MKKTTQLLIVSILLIINCQLSIVNCAAQTPSWLWAENGDGSTSQNAKMGIANDADGNTIVCGNYLSDSITFGYYTLHNSSPGSYDLFLVKYDATGNVIWAVSHGGDGDDYSYSVATDATGNIYVTGTIGSDSIIFGNTTLHGTNFHQVFVVKYNANGDVVWARGPQGSIAFNGIATDAAANVYLAGSLGTNMNLIFGNDTLTSTIYLSRNFILVKYDSSGNPIWGRMGACSGNSEPYVEPHYVTTDAMANVFVTGGFASPTLNFGHDTILDSVQALNMFVVKYDSSGNSVWAKKVGTADGIGQLQGKGVGVDAHGNVYIGGDAFSTRIDFGTDTLNTIALYDIFMAKYDQTGNFVWAKVIGGDDYDYCSGLKADPNGDFYITGYFGSTYIALGLDTIHNSNALGNQNIYVIKYNASGNELWASAPAGDGQSAGIAGDGHGNEWITGYYPSTTMVFGTHTLNNNSGGNDIFTAKLMNLVTAIPVENKGTVRIYPNPNTGSFTLAYAQLSAVTQFKVTDLFGRTVYTQNITGARAEQTINAGILQDGVYFWQLISANRIEANGKMTVLR